MFLKHANMTGTKLKFVLNLVMHLFRKRFQSGSVFSTLYTTTNNEYIGNIKTQSRNQPSCISYSQRTWVKSDLWKGFHWMSKRQLKYFQKFTLPNLFFPISISKLKLWKHFSSKQKNIQLNIICTVIICWLQKRLIEKCPGLNIKIKFFLNYK